MAIALPKIFWPVTSPVGGWALRLNNGADFTASMGAFTAFTSAAQYATILQAAILPTIPSMLVSVSPTGRMVFKCNVPGWQIKAGDALSTAYAQLGMFAITYNAVNDPATYGVGTPHGITIAGQVQNGWWSDVAAAEDSLPYRNLGSRVVTRAMNGKAKFVSENELFDRELVFRFLKPHKAWLQYEGTSNVYESLERVFTTGYSRFRYWADASVEGTSEDLMLKDESLKEWKPKRMFNKKALYEVTLNCMRFV